MFYGILSRLFYHSMDGVLRLQLLNWEIQTSVFCVQKQRLHITED